MFRFRLPMIALATLASIAACDARDPVAEEANHTAGLPDVNDAVPNATGAPPETGAAAAAETPTAAVSIPAALHGRWGLVPGDCTSTRGDAKGLLIIGAEDLRFYESRAVPSGNLKSDEHSISGDFSFTGEGQSWIKFQSLQVRGRELVRTETTPAASFSYAKCE